MALQQTTKVTQSSNFSLPQIDEGPSLGKSVLYLGINGKTELVHSYSKYN